MTPSQSINHARNIALVGIITGFLLINLMIALVYILILRRITSSLTMITNSANKMSKGQSTQPVSVVSHDEIGLLAQSFNDMLNNVQTKTAELISERNRSKMILTQLPDGIIVTDAKDRLISANRAAETMLGFSTDRAKGQDIIKYIKNENVTKLFSLHLKESKNTTVVRELMIPTSDGTQENYQITLSPLLDTTYQQTGIITVIRNITDETKVRSSRDHFLQSITHELRTPLTSIIGFLDIVLKENFGPLVEKQREFITVTKHNAQYLKKLLADLLNLSHIHSGKLELNQSFFSIQLLVDNISQSQSHFIEKRGNELTIQIPDNDIKFYGDFHKLLHAFQNLIIHANKTTADGVIELSVNQTSSFTTFIIKDSGHGLTKPQKTQLIHALELQSNYNYFSYDGLGLELALVKEFVHVHNGQVLVESEEGKNYFTVILPHTMHQPPHPSHDDMTENHPFAHS